MTTFVDGPAAGQVLSLRRCPLFLRVTFNRFSNQWDALDQLHDEPAAAETLYAYVRFGEACKVRVCGRGSGGVLAVANYRLVESQPGRATMFSRERWRAWCETEAERARDLATAPAG